MELTNNDYERLVKNAVKNGNYILAVRWLKEWKGLTTDEAIKYYKTMPEYQPEIKH